MTQDEILDFTGVLQWFISFLDESASARGESFWRGTPKSVDDKTTGKPSLLHAVVARGAYLSNKEYVPLSAAFVHSEFLASFLLKHVRCQPAYFSTIPSQRFTESGIHYIYTWYSAAITINSECMGES